MDRHMLAAAIGEFPEKTPLQSQILHSIDCGTYIRQKVEYYTEPDEAIRAFFCVPKQRRSRTPAIFCHHQHDWNFALGKSEVVGLAGDSDQAFAAELAEQGYITLAPDAIGFEERNWTGGTFESAYFELATRLVSGRTLLAKVLHDAVVGINYMESREEVDASRMGFIGHSYGGRMAIWVPAFDKRIKASVSSCGCVRYRDSFHRGAGIQMEFCVPGIGNLGDIEDVVALAAPTPLYLSVAEDDPWSRGAMQIVESVQSCFPDNTLKIAIWPGGHAFTKPMRAESYRFLDTHLGRPGAIEKECAE
jgi:dienelactone hydrolase